MSSLGATLHTEYFNDGTYGRQVHQTGVDGGESWAYTDGLGRSLLQLTRAANNQWVATGLPDRTLADHVVTTYRPVFYSGPTSFPISLGQRQIARQTVLDSLGRPTKVLEPDDSGNATVVVGTTTYHGLGVDVQDSAQRAALLVSKVLLDGYGHVREGDKGDGLDVSITKMQYLATGEPARIAQSHANGSETIVRWMQYDSEGHMVLNAEPNTSFAFSLDPSAIGAMRAWRYAYDDAGKLVGTSDARGCGINYYYDNINREVAEDYSPCLDSQATYTVPNLTTGDGTESFSQYDYPTAGEPLADYGNFAFSLMGRLAARSDRGALTRVAYDGRGRTSRMARQVAVPGPASNMLAVRYAPTWSRRAFRYTDGDQLAVSSTGADVALLQNNAQSDVRYYRDPRGALTSVTSSYDSSDGIPAPLVQFGAPLADGLPTSVTYGDLARTQTTFDSWDNRGRLKHLTTHRNAPALWSGPTNGTYQTHPDATAQLQTYLTKVTIGYQLTDDIGNILDERDFAAWPVGAKPVALNFSNDPLHRLTYTGYNSGGDVQQIPYAKEYINMGGGRWSGDLRATGGCLQSRDSPEFHVRLVWQHHSVDV